MDSTRMITRTAARFFSGTMLSRVSGLMRDIALATFYGATPELAAFMIAFRFANLPRRLFGEGAMHSAFVPIYEQIRAEDPQRAARFFRALSSRITLLLVLILSAVALPLLFSRSTVCQMTLLMLPSTLFLCQYGLNSALLNTERVYFLPSVAPVLFNLVLVCAAPFVSLYALALYVVLGFALSWLLTALPLRHLPRAWSSSDLHRITKPLFLGILGVAATQINNALDPLFARAADPSGPAYLWYALRVQQLPLSLFGIALSGALLPPLTRSVGTPDFDRFLRFAQRQALFLMIPATLGLLMLGRPILALLFQRGHFTALDTGLTLPCLRAYAIGLIPATLVLIRASACYACHDFRTPARAAALAVLFNIAANTIAIFVFHLGPASIAATTSLSSLLQLLFLKSLGVCRQY